MRWRRVDWQAVIAKEFKVELSERHVGRILRQRGFTRLSARPRHPKTDEGAQETFKKSFADTVAAALPASARGKRIEVWFQDEARVGQKRTLTRLERIFGPQTNDKCGVLIRSSGLAWAKARTGPKSFAYTLRRVSN